MPHGWYPRPATKPAVRLCDCRGQRFRCIHAGAARLQTARAAVSLHSHSAYSREKLDIVPALARSIPLVRALFERSVARYEREHGRPLDFADVHWRPPLPPAAVIASEHRQIERRFDLPAIVSLTDHDTLEGAKSLRAAGRLDVPLSIEWSVPFNGSMFHLGVHGLPPRRLHELEGALAAYSSADARRLGDLLEAVGECPETVVVLNHPFWDLEGIGQLRHDAILLAFLRRHSERIHALELNGYRAWGENRRVLPLAEAFGRPVVGGGDRHGSTPNTIVNLTGASCHGEFAHELRASRTSHCVIFPEHAEPHAARVLQSAADILRSDQRYVRRAWPERTFIATPDGERSIDAVWARMPRWVGGAVLGARILASPVCRPLFGLTWSDGRALLERDCRPDTSPEQGPRLAIRGSAAVL